jgi:hypothetical protein
MLKFARVSLPFAVGLFFAALILSVVVGDAGFALLIPAGLVLAARGLLMLTQRDEVLAPLATAESAGWTGRLGFRTAHPAGAALLTIIGAAWIIVGVALTV